MSYILKNNFNTSRSKSPFKKILVLSLVAVFFTIIFYFWSGPLGSLSVAIGAPFLRAYNGVADSVGSAAGIFSPKTNLIRENQELKERIVELEKEKLGWVAEQSELSVSDTRENFKQEAIAAMPISFPPRIPFDTVLIDKGMREGIQNGKNVFLTDGVQIGTIEETFSGTARVKLFSAAGIKTEAVSVRTGEVVELSGYGGGNLKTELPIDFDVILGDFFALPGEPRMIIAEVQSVLEARDSSFISVLLSIPLKIDGNTILYVAS